MARYSLTSKEFFMSDLLQNLQWRYATKKMDPAKKVAKEKIDRILEAVRLTASSSGLQQYEMFVVTTTPCVNRSRPMPGTRRR